MILAVHVFACLFWRLKYENDPDELQSFLVDKSLTMDVRALSNVLYF